MRLGLYGGSFDPIHRGHVDPILAACRQLKLDRVLYLPTAHPPHKSKRRLAPAWARFSMVEMALLDHSRLRTSSFEMDRSPCYTYDTVSHFRQQHPDARLFLIIGLDSFLALGTWYRGDELAMAIELVVLVRPGVIPGGSLDPAALDRAPRQAFDAGHVHLVNNPPVAASSTELRRLLANGDKPPAGWLDSRVLNYARKYDLYASHPAAHEDPSSQPS